MFFRSREKALQDATEKAFIEGTSDITRYLPDFEMATELRRAAHLTLIKQRVAYWICAVVAAALPVGFALQPVDVVDETITTIGFIACIPAAFFVVLAILTHCGFSRAHKFYRLLDAPETVSKIYFLDTGLTMNRHGPFYTSNEVVFQTNRNRRVFLSAPPYIRTLLTDYSLRNHLLALFPNAKVEL